MKLVISFCNQTGNLDAPNLLVLDLNTASKQWIKIDVDNDGFTGVAQDKKYIYALYQAPKNQDLKAGIVIIDKETLRVKLTTELPGLYDPHSCVIDEHGDIYAVSTGTEQVLKYRFNDRAETITLQGCVWHPYTKSDHIATFFKNLWRLRSFPKKETKEFFWRIRKGTFWTPEYMRHLLGTHHLNSLFLSNANLFISGFGPPKSELFTSATEGYIFDIKQRKKTHEHINHPHSVFVNKGDLFYCESRTRTVKKRSSALITLENGYTRGLAIADDLLIVGSSASRKKSRSTGLVNNTAEDGLQACRISVFKKNDTSQEYEIVEEIEFFPDKQEIYDVVTLTST